MIIAIPDVIAAIVVLIIGVVVAYFLKAVVVRLLRALRVGHYAAKFGVNRVFPGEFDLVELLGDLVKWFFIIVFLLQALAIVHLQEVNDVVNQILGYIPNVVAAAVVLFVGFVVADLLSRLVRDTAQALGSMTASLLGHLTRWAVVVLVVFTALAQLGVNTIFLDRLFTAVVAMLALAGGLAFGLGGREAAADVLSNVRGMFRERK